MEIQMKSLHIRFKDEQVEELKKISESTNEDISKIIRRAVEVYIEDYMDYLAVMENLSGADGELVDAEEVEKEFGL